ncbi:MAG: helix-turn-helix domain-containing protein [Firmicutes bacterium]|jgi:transcriptional regulator with XRE-family HTH domain|nr:helix-turn-helix domain-containing protein [Bacillota bacterium]
MEFYRIGDKLISQEKAVRVLERIFTLRASGLSQQEVANRVGCDRTFVSRLETMAEVRKGGSLAVIGFPIANTEELNDVCANMGVEYTFLLTDAERWKFIESMSGYDLLNWLMELMSEMRAFDNVVMIGSDMRIKLAEAILGDKVIGFEIGESPITQDVYIQPKQLEDLITTIKGVVR